MKKSLCLLCLLITLLFACQLSESGRKSSLVLSFSQPEIMKELLSSADNSERMILSGTTKIEIILYKPYNSDPLNDSEIIETFDNIAQVKARPETRSIILSPGGIPTMNHTISNIDPGTWNILVGTFIENGEIWSNGEISELITYRLKRNVEIQSGLNYIDLPLKPNFNNYYKFIDPYSAVDGLENGTGTSGTDFILLNPVVGLIVVTGFYTTETHIIPPFPAFAPSYRFFDGEGRMLYLQFNGSYWLWNPVAGNNDLIILVEYLNPQTTPTFSISGGDYAPNIGGFYELTVLFNT